MEILEWIKNTKFQCDVTKDYFSYHHLYVAWYDKLVREDTKTINYTDIFMLTKQNRGFDRPQSLDNEWSLSARPLEMVFSENVLLFFTRFLVVDSIHDKGNFEKTTNIKSWNELFRRLTIPNYEYARHRLKEAKHMDYFSEMTEFELLQSENLERFYKSLS